jgi:hypothetical protein
MSQLRVNTITDAGGTGSTYAPGHVVQVVSTTKTDVFSASVASGGTVAVTGLTAAITPRSTLSRIFIVASVFGDGPDNISIIPTRNGSVITGATGDASESRGRIFAGNGDASAFTQVGGSASILFLDSPSTTSSTTYGINLFSTSGATNTLFVNRTLGDGNSSFVPRGTSTITLMEIAQ